MNILQQTWQHEYFVAEDADEWQNLDILIGVVPLCHCDADDNYLVTNIVFKDEI